MRRLSDDVLRSYAEHGVCDDPRDGSEMARELLAARKVVEACRIFKTAMTVDGPDKIDVNISDIVEYIEAYDSLFPEEAE